MPKIAKEQMEPETQTEALKQETLRAYKQLYDDDEIERLYMIELPKFKEYVDKLVKDKCDKMLNDKCDKVVEDKDRKQVGVKVDIDSIRNNIIEYLSREDYEKIFEKSTEYIKSTTFHSYDGSFYVLNKNDKGHIIPLEFNQATFNSTYLKYVSVNGPLLKKWFDKYSENFVLTVNNSNPRTFKTGSSNYLNLFAGYKYVVQGRVPGRISSVTN